MRDAWPYVKDLLLLGGGHAHALVLRMWAMQPVPGARLTLISPDPVTPYTGMLPGLAAGLYRREDVLIDLVRLCDRAQARFILGRVEGIDPAGRRVMVAGREAVPFDLLSVDVGGEAAVPPALKAATQAIAARPLGAFAERWARFVDEAPAEPVVVVVGAGAGGAELALSAVHRLAAAGRRPTVHLADRAGTVLAALSAPARWRMLAELTAAGVSLRPGVEVTAAQDRSLLLSDGTVLDADLVIVAAGVTAPDWLAASGLAVEGGWLRVGPTLQTSDPAILAAGDCAHLAHAPRAKAGVFSVRAAPVLRHNLCALLSGGRLRNFRPQRDFLRLMALGDGRAVADWKGMAATGTWVWRWKNRIDRQFMDSFDRIPPMLRPAPPVPAAQGLEALLDSRPQCAGCGAKVGSQTLATGLSVVPAAARADILCGVGDDAAVLKIGDILQVLSTDHLRALTRDEALMARLAVLHALSDVLAMGAAPQVALSTVVLPPASETVQARMLAAIQHAAGKALTEAGAALVGGHTTVGAELTLGFTVTGTVAPDALRRKAGARPGDALVLSRPLGNGTILAALMAGTPLPGLLLGECVAAALRQMARSPVPAARQIAPLAHAMTDVTGFGLAGHLLEMCRASGTGAVVHLAQVPLLPGALALSARGETSSLYPANRATTLGQVVAPDSPAARLLWDPQTCGGFLAAVPADAADGLVAILHELGEPAARIGQVTEGGTTSIITVR